MKIKIIDSILSQADEELVPHITPCLQYQRTFWKQGQYKKDQITKPAYFIHRRSGVFLTGLLSRIQSHLNLKKVFYDVFYPKQNNLSSKRPYLKGINFRPDQSRLIQNCYEHKRGVILAPTRFGKTIVALGFISMFPKAKILFLCDTLDIINQTVDEFKRFGFGDIAKLGEGNKDWKGYRIVVSTIQTFVKLDPVEYCHYFDITIVDEVHHCTGKWNSNQQTVSGRYGTVLCHNLSPIKLGFTATLPVEKEKILSMEGLIGSVIGEMSQQESIKLEITMKPKVELIPVPYKTNISKHRKYKDLYEYGIVCNRIRNKLITKLTKDRIKQEITVLIMVKEIQHGLNIQELAKKIFDLDIEFIKGSTDSETRNLTKNAFIKKKVKAVISTAVWREGINIPSLNCTINAIGGKSEIMTLQAVGRGLTKIEGKNHAEIIDFLDPYRYLAEHCVQRLSIYKNNGWI